MMTSGELSRFQIINVLSNTDSEIPVGHLYLRAVGCTIHSPDREEGIS